jgi:GT2 family glycosyltransferase
MRIRPVSGATIDSGPLTRRAITPSAGSRLPLAGLRCRLDTGSAAQWVLHPDGVLGRALLTPAGTVVSFPLTLSGEVTFSARAMLLPHDWRDGTGAVRATVTITDGDGRRRRLGSALLRAGDRGRPRGIQISCRLPADTTSLGLAVDRHGIPGPGAAGRAIWVEPVITDPDARTDPHAPPTPHTPPATPAPTGPPPTISVLTPVHDPPLHMLQEAIASVHNQTYPHWQLCLVDDGSTHPEIITALRHHAAADPRIHLTRHDTAGGISAATNTALHDATGDYIALLDHDDTLTPDALQHVADQITADPDLDMLYSDEDIIDDAGPIERHPKPGWSPEHMTALMYTCHLGVYRRTLALAAGGFQSRFDGCQDYDFVLRLMDRTDRIAHIPRVLYHWRAHARSTAGGDQAKPYAYLAQPGAIAEHLRRCRIDAEIQFGPSPGLHRIVHRVDPSTSVAFVLAVRDARGLRDAAASWLAQPHPTWTVIVTAPSATLPTVTDALAAAGIPDRRITTIPTDPDAAAAAALATAAQAATAEHLLLLQTPLVGLTFDWLTRLLGYSAQPGIAAAGPVLLAADGRIDQAGVALPDGVPLYLHHGRRPVSAQPVVYNVSAVSGAVLTPRATYQRLGGLDPTFADLALIDYCIRAIDTDQRIVIVPDARLRVTSPDPITNDLPQIWRLRDRWTETHPHDPYYNPNYRTDRGDFVLR